MTASADSTRSLTIVSVAYPDARLLQTNLELTRHLNPRHQSRWIVVDNTPEAGLGLSGSDGVEILPGVARLRGRDMGSLHHASALQKAFDEVRTRFVLFLDPDFYVVRRDWIAGVLSHVSEHEVAIFGSVWHPRWFWQYRRFPSVHFMLVDLERVPRETIDLAPAIAGDRWWRFINRHKTPLPDVLRDTLKATRIRDTGWRLHRRYRDDPSVRVETLVLHWSPPEDGRLRWERRLSGVLPDSWRKYPADLAGFTEASFLGARWPDAYKLGWEEHFWQGEPFAVHLRKVGRAMLDGPLVRDDEVDDEVMERFVADVIAEKGIEPL
jgi:hypothetical protein